MLVKLYHIYVATQNMCAYVGMCRHVVKLCIVFLANQYLLYWCVAFCFTVCQCGVILSLSLFNECAVQCSLTCAEQEFIGHQSTALAAPVRNLSLEYFKTNHRQVSDL